MCEQNRFIECLPKWYILLLLGFKQLITFHICAYFQSDCFDKLNSLPVGEQLIMYQLFCSQMC